MVRLHPAIEGCRASLLTIPVFMIRASNLPVLLIIALYERQNYRETTLMEQIGDFAEKYVGNLPRRLKSAGGCLLS
jgi:predicted LPLAT superfamily acyltransferase